MKAKKILLMDRHEICNPKIVTTEMFNEAIAELEALQSRSCERCKYLYINKHSEFVEYCTDLNIEIPYSDITTFCCNRYEPKEQ